MVSANEKTLKTMAYAVIALCCIIVFGNASQQCSKKSNIGDILGIPGEAIECGKYVKATVAFGVIGFIIAAVMLVLWFIADEFAAKSCLPVSNFLFAWLGVGEALILQTGVGLPLQTAIMFLLGCTIFFVAVVFALLLSVYNWNNANYSIKLVSEVKTPASVDAPPGLQEEQA